MHIFEYSSYKSFVNDWLAAQPKAGHGLRRQMAATIGTQTGFITQVLSGNAHFSPEQTLALAAFLGLSIDDTQFLLLLLQYERAGTAAYKEHIHRQLIKAREDHLNLSKRLKVKKMPSEVDQGIYFSSWLYACVHVLTTCKRFQSNTRLMAKSLQVSHEQILDTLDFLTRTGLVKKEKDKYITGDARVHLGIDSPFLRRHHSNWNILALQQILSSPLSQGLHYSSVISLAESDVVRVQEVFTKAIEEAKKITRESEGEKVFLTTLNFGKIC